MGFLSAFTKVVRIAKPRSSTVQFISKPPVRQAVNVIGSHSDKQGNVSKIISVTHPTKTSVQDNVISKPQMNFNNSVVRTSTSNKIIKPTTQKTIRVSNQNVGNNVRTSVAVSEFGGNLRTFKPQFGSGQINLENAILIRPNSKIPYQTQKNIGNNIQLQVANDGLRDQTFGSVQQMIRQSDLKRLDVGGVPLGKVANLSSARNVREFKKGDILISSRGTIGKVRQFDEDTRIFEQFGEPINKRGSFQTLSGHAGGKTDSYKDTAFEIEKASFGFPDLDETFKVGNYIDEGKIVKPKINTASELGVQDTASRGKNLINESYGGINARNALVVKPNRIEDSDIIASHLKQLKGVDSGNSKSIDRLTLLNTEIKLDSGTVKLSEIAKVKKSATNVEKFNAGDLLVQRRFSAVSIVNKVGNKYVRTDHGRANIFKFENNIVRKTRPEKLIPTQGLGKPTSRPPPLFGFGMGQKQSPIIPFYTPQAKLSMVDELNQSSAVFKGLTPETKQSIVKFASKDNNREIGTKQFLVSLDSPMGAFMFKNAGTRLNTEQVAGLNQLVRSDIASQSLGRSRTFIEDTASRGGNLIGRQFGDVNTSNAFLIRPNEKLIDPQFFGYALENTVNQGGLKKFGGSGTAIDLLRKGDLESVELIGRSDLFGLPINPNIGEIATVKSARNVQNFQKGDVLVSNRGTFGRIFKFGEDQTSPLIRKASELGVQDTSARGVDLIRGVPAYPREELFSTQLFHGTISENVEPLLKSQTPDFTKIGSGVGDESTRAFFATDSKVFADRYVIPTRKEARGNSLDMDSTDKFGEVLEVNLKPNTKVVNSNNIKLDDDLVLNNKGNPIRLKKNVLEERRERIQIAKEQGFDVLLQSGGMKGQEFLIINPKVIKSIKRSGKLDAKTEDNIFQNRQTDFAQSRINTASELGVQDTSARGGLLNSVGTARFEKINLGAGTSKLNTTPQNDALFGLEVRGMFNTKFTANQQKKILGQAGVGKDELGSFFSGNKRNTRTTTNDVRNELIGGDELIADVENVAFARVSVDTIPLANVKPVFTKPTEVQRLLAESAGVTAKPKFRGVRLTARQQDQVISSDKSLYELGLITKQTPKNKQAESGFRNIFSGNDDIFLAPRSNISNKPLILNVFDDVMPTRTRVGRKGIGIDYGSFGSNSIFGSDNIKVSGTQGAGLRKILNSVNQVKRGNNIRKNRGIFDITDMDNLDFGDF